MGRAKLTGAEDNLAMVTIVSEGNPGALRALMAIITNPDLDQLTKLQVVCTADAMGIRGWLLYLGYHDWAQDRQDVFISAIQQRSKTLIDFLNSHEETKYLNLVEPVGSDLE